MNDDQLRQFINRCLGEFHDKNQKLIAVCANERSMTHKLAEVIAKYIGSQWDVDCEYNRDQHDPKRLSLRNRKHDSHFDNYSVYPDIIIHKRQTAENYIVIEVKKNTNNEDRAWDIEKLKGYKTQLGYRHCVFIDLSCDGTPDVVQINDECA